MPVTQRLEALQRATDILEQAQLPDLARLLRLAKEREQQPPALAPAQWPRYFRSVIVVEVISEDLPILADMSLQEIAYAITEGDCSGLVTLQGSSELDASQARQALEEQGSAASFFQSLSEDDQDEGEDDTAQPGASRCVRDCAG